MLPLIGLIIGLVIGLVLNVQIPEAWSVYVAVVILCGVDSLLGGLEATLRKRFSNTLFITGFLLNASAAIALTALGQQLDFDLSLVAVFAFGIRIFRNLGLIRRYIVIEIRDRRQKTKSLTK
ncbi:MAG TPA: small basic family protein [Clostridiaceae bacterium]|nr:small basic family protein [Clostridiaceae bacterium]